MSHTVVTTEVTDVVVVGGGVAGSVAALAAAEQGARVLVLDKADGVAVVGNSLVSGGVIHAAYHSPWADPKVLAASLTSSTGGSARNELVETWAANVGRAVTYLLDRGAEIARDGDAAYLATVLQPRSQMRQDPLGTQYWRGQGPDRLLGTLRRQIEQHGGTARSGVRVTELLHDGVGVRGVLVGSRSKPVSASAVVIADGGFHANAELVHRYITPQYAVRGGNAATGDGLRMALAIGAKAVNMDAFYGHAVVRDAMVNPRLAPAPSPEALIDHGVLVDGSGSRFVEEWRGDEEWSEIADVAAGAIAKSATPGSCWAVFDDQAWQTVGRQGVTPCNPTLLDEGATVLTADTLPDLAERCGLASDKVLRSVQDAATASSAEGRQLMVRRPPFYAVPVVAGITFTMGGLLVNTSAQVLDHDEHVIAGLFAAGGAMGGLQGGPRNGYAGGWSEAVTFGLIAGENAARLAVKARQGMNDATSADKSLGQSPR